MLRLLGNLCNTYGVACVVTHKLVGHDPGHDAPTVSACGGYNIAVPFAQTRLALTATGVWSAPARAVCVEHSSSLPPGKASFKITEGEGICDDPEAAPLS